MHFCAAFATESMVSDTQMDLRNEAWEAAITTVLITFTGLIIALVHL